jgi:hypothetical protein
MLTQDADQINGKATALQVRFGMRYSPFYRESSIRFMPTAQDGNAQENPLAIFLSF